MPANHGDQRRHRYADHDRRGHPLQHRDSDDDGGDSDQHSGRHNEHGWAERGTWTHLHDDPGGRLDSHEGAQPDRPGRSVDDSPVRQVTDSAHSDQSTQRSDAASDFGSSPQGNDQRRATPERAYGGRSSTPTYQAHGNPRTGSHMGTDSDLGISGEAGGQFGDLHGQRPSDSERAGYHDDDWIGSHGGRPARDDQFGSRRGHGTRRREDPRAR